jgi:hypothetical protein
MTKRPKKRSVKARNPIAKNLRDPLFHLRLKPSKKLYQRTPKHRGRRSNVDLGDLAQAPVPSSKSSPPALLA